MLESVQVINKNGDAMNTEGIAYIELIETNKKYLFYTLNEKVDNDLTKIYIAEVSENVGGANPISDAEWDDLRKKMLKISHKEEVPEIQYLPMGTGIFNIGEPKKLAVSDLNKQTFKDEQIKNAAPDTQSDTPVVSGTTTFFASNPEHQDVVPETSSNESIFANPPQPVENATVNPVSEPVETPNVTDMQPVLDTSPLATGNGAAIAPMEIPTATPVGEPVVIQPVIDNVQINEPVVGATMVQPAVETPVIQTEPVEQITPIVESIPSVLPESTINQTVSVQASTPVQNINPIETSNTPVNSKAIITDEEALKAISIIQDYIAQEEAA